MKRNVPILGLVIGLIMPLFGVAIMYFVWFGGTPFAGFLNTMLNSHDLASKVLSLSLLLELIPFIYYTSKRLDYTARGVLIATMLYAVLIILIKFVW